MTILTWNGQQINQRDNDGMVNLTQMAQAIPQVDLDRFMKSARLNEIKSLLYELQEGRIVHPVQIEDGNVWVDSAIASEFSYQLVHGGISQAEDRFKFAIALSRFLFRDIIHPEIFSEVLNYAIAMSNQPSEIDQTLSAISKKTPGFVYFMFNEATQLVKIGHSQNPDCRFVAFTTATTDKWVEIGRLKGTKVSEREYHSMFAESRVPRKELFHLTEKLENFLYESFDWALYESFN